VKRVEEWTAAHVPNGADGQVRRAVDRFALVAAAGEFATSLGILPWRAGAANDAASRMLADWITMRGGVEPAEVSAGVAAVRRFIEAHGESRFALFDTRGIDERPVANRAGFRRGQGEDREWLVLPEAWRSEVAVGHDPGLLARALVERGMMKVGGDGKPQIKTHIPRLGKARIYILTSRLFKET
jgi:putative DNA primase/helicase